MIKTAAKETKLPSVVKQNPFIFRRIANHFFPVVAAIRKNILLLKKWGNLFFAHIHNAERNVDGGGDFRDGRNVCLIVVEKDVRLEYSQNARFVDSA